MGRCQHCNKLTHSENLFVEFSIQDFDLIDELRSLKDFKNPWEYPSDGLEYGRLKCGDIWIAFIAKENKSNECKPS